FTEIFAQAGSIGSERGEDEAAVRVEARQRLEAERAGIEIWTVAGAHRHADEPPVGGVGPAMIGAAEAQGAAAFVLAHLGAAVRAAIDQRLDASVLLTHREHGNAGQADADEVAGGADLALVAEIEPHPREQALALPGEDRWIGVDPAVD